MKVINIWGYHCKFSNILRSLLYLNRVDFNCKSNSARVHNLFFFFFYLLQHAYFYFLSLKYCKPDIKLYLILFFVHREQFGTRTEEVWLFWRIWRSKLLILFFSFFWFVLSSVYMCYMCHFLCVDPNPAYATHDLWSLLFWHIRPKLLIVSWCHNFLIIS